MTNKDLFDLESSYLDIEAIESGRWIPLGSNFPGVEVYVKGLSSPEAKAYRDALTRKAPRGDRTSNGQLTEMAQERILKQTVIEKCVMDWRGLGSKGKPLPFSKEVLENLMNEPKARPVATAIVLAITDLENKTKSDEEDLEKN